MSRLLRVLIAVMASIVAITRPFSADLKFDITRLDLSFLSAAVVALLLFFARDARLSGITFWGMKFDFAEVKPKPAELERGLVAEKAKSPGRWSLHSEHYIDGYFDRIRKLVPIETVLAYIVSTNLFEGESYFHGSFRWAMLAFWLAATPVYYIREVGVAQAIVLTLSFISVSFALGEPFSSLSWYAPGTGAVVLVITVLLSPLMFSLIAEPSRR